MNLTIIIPVYNEINYIPKVISKLSKLSLTKTKINIIIIDDFSIDGTREWLKKNQANINKTKNKIKIIYKKKNEGKGSAVIEGLKNISVNDVILIQDADLEYDPNDIKKLWILIKKGNDVVFGNRFHGLNHYHYKIFALANFIISKFTSFLFFKKISDVAVCYKMFKKRILKYNITLKEKDFMFDFEFTSKILKNKKFLKIAETNISYFGRTFKDGKKISWMDGFKAILVIIRIRLFD